MRIHRRDFLKLPACLALSHLAPLGAPLAHAAGGTDNNRYVREASWYKKLPERQVECTLCPRHCVVADQETGWCGVRTNREGIYQTQVWGRPVTIHNDPIEKKPLFHVLPGTQALSFSTAGCNFECVFCQNWEISQFRPEQRPARFGFVSAQDMVAMARKQAAKTIAMTYGEPVVFFEYALAVARAGKQAGIPGIMISNGYIEPGPLDELLAELGALKVDFKAYSEDFYAKKCRGTLKPVLATMEQAVKRGVWLEMVHLTIPTLNDSEQETKALCRWVLDHLGPDVPLHFSRFHPTYKLKNLPATPPATLERQYGLARALGIHYPYVGNLPGHGFENTICHHCGEVVIKRVGYSIVENKLDQGKCTACQKQVPGVWALPGN